MLLVAALLGPLGFGVVLLLIGVGMTTTALAFRRSLVAASPVLELLIRGASVYPGVRALVLRGRRRRRREVALVTSRATGAPEAREVVHGDGLLLCPGFIDLHAHSALRSFDYPFLTPKLAQGFTTEVINPDGLAPAPVAPAGAPTGRLPPAARSSGRDVELVDGDEYLDALEATRPALSLVSSVGHGAVRDLVLGGERVRAVRR